MRVSVMGLDPPAGCGRAGAVSRADPAGLLAGRARLGKRLARPAGKRAGSGKTTASAAKANDAASADW
ncbi:MAG: hypothetical protein RIB52_01405 [Erythrobacter sp.]